MKKNIKNILAFIVSLLLMFVLLITSLTMFFRGSILNPQTYIDVVEKHGIYDEIYENIYSNIKYLLLTNNIPENTLDGVINKDEVIQITNDFIYYTVGYMKNEQNEIPAVKMEIYQSRVDNAMKDYLLENSIYLNDEFKNNLNEFKSTIYNIIKSDLELININELSKSSAMKAVAKISSVIDSGSFIVGLFIMVIILSSLFFIIWKKRKARRFVWIGYSFVSCGILITLVGLSGYISGFYNYIAISIPYLATAISLIIKKWLFDLSMIGTSVLLVGICFMAVYWRHLYKKYKGHENLKIL